MQTNWIRLILGCFILPTAPQNTTGGQTDYICSEQECQDWTSLGQKETVPEMRCAPSCTCVFLELWPPRQKEIGGFRNVSWGATLTSLSVQNLEGKKGCTPMEETDPCSVTSENISLLLCSHSHRSPCWAGQLCWWRNERGMSLVQAIGWKSMV